MPYVMNFIRVPKAGKAFELLEAMKKSHSASGKQGGITVPISGAVPTNSRPGLISLVRGFDTLDDVDDFQNAFLSNSDAQKSQMSIEELCDKNSYSVSEILANTEQSEDSEDNVVSRLVMVAKPGKTPDLIKELMAINEKVGTGFKSGISRPIAGPIGAVRVTTLGTSLRDLENKRIETVKHVGKIPDLISSSPVRHLGRIVYRNKG